MAVLWWALADLAFEGKARSLLYVDVLAVAIAALCACLVAASWRQRGLVFVLIVAVAATLAGGAFLAVNLLLSQSHG